MTDNDNFKSDEELTSLQALPLIEPPKCDIEKYREQVEVFDLTTEEEDELIKSLWMIMAAFVDIGFGVDSIQLLSSSNLKQGLAPTSNLDKQDEHFKLNGGKHDD